MGERVINFTRPIVWFPSRTSSNCVRKLDHRERAVNDITAPAFRLLKETQEKIEYIWKQQEQIRQSLDKIEKQHDEIRNQQDKIRKEHDEIRKEQNEIRKEQNEITKEHDEIRNQHDEIRKEQNEIRKEHDEIRGQQKELKRKIESLEEKLKAREVYTPLPQIQDSLSNIREKDNKIYNPPSRNEKKDKRIFFNFLSNLKKLLTMFIGWW